MSKLWTGLYIIYIHLLNFTPWTASKQTGLSLIASIDAIRTAIPTPDDLCAFGVQIL
ncbi:MAG TPA: hypothetical protein VF318_05515 [Dehalococcoidales bacterium]